MAKPAKRKKAFELNVREAMLIVELVKFLPGKPHRATVDRYCKRGVVSPISGRRIKMPYLHTPRGIASTVDAYFYFLEELNED